MKIVIDYDIPYIKGVFEKFFDEIIYIKGNQIDSKTVRNAHALIVRTRTFCNAQLLNGSSVKVIATATVGTDHIDLSYCKINGICVYSAAGCNRGAVLQWVLASIHAASEQFNFDLKGKVLGVVGVGNIGSLVAKAAKALEMDVLLCDPPRKESEGLSNFFDLNFLAKNSDIITFHVPLTQSGSHATFNMAENEFFSKIKPNSLLLNSARGGIINEMQLTEMLKKSKILGAAIDVWQGEPNVLDSLLNACFIATPHIAGYSIEGKVNATAMVIDSISRHFELGITNWNPVPNPVEFKIDMNLSKYLDNNSVCFNKLFKDIYPIVPESTKFKENPLNFEVFRNSYGLRRENGGYKFISSNAEIVNKFEGLGFSVDIS